MGRYICGIYLSIIVLLYPQSGLTGEDPGVAKAGEAVVARVCANCHGMNGLAVQGGNSAISPIITAQKEDYLVARLMDYRAGKIQHPQMSLIANMISEQDIQDVSEWYSLINISSPIFGKSAAEIDRLSENFSDKALSGKDKVVQACASCHGIDGRAIPSTEAILAPNLVPQEKHVLEFRLRDYKSGRKNHPVMTPIAKGLSDQEIENISEWYGSIEFSLQESK
ncbi:MAG: c-type cytochrome [Gammaproteobacteria bacterium]|nr:c-type cytochrome [Gammaproteobacteria bacterium]